MEAAMQDSVAAIDTSFEHWTKPGDENARAEAIRLACELDALTRLLARKPAPSLHPDKRAGFVSGVVLSAGRPTSPGAMPGLLPE
jgi:hypothetical protein